MTASPTEQYVRTLTTLKRGDLGLLRLQTGRSLANTVHGFDLFAGLWWPLQSKDSRAPQRDVAWLIAKVYAAVPLECAAGDTLARQLGRCQPPRDEDRNRFCRRFDQMLSSPLDAIEFPLGWCLGELAHRDMKVDWVHLIDDLSIWERDSTRLRWSRQFLGED
jgi:CRISPR type I-E-associated protein CasB/Cse2